MTYRASQTPLKGGFSAFRDFVDREYLRIQRAFATKAEVEQGVFTPTFDFATTGDLTHSYTTQSGQYWLIGPLLHFSLTVNDTPTFTTASGNVQIGGLPYPHTTTIQPVFAVKFGASSITYPVGTSVYAYINTDEQFLQLAAQGSAANASTITAADFTSGSSTTAISVTGFYQIT